MRDRIIRKPSDRQVVTIEKRALEQARHKVIKIAIALASFHNAIRALMQMS